MISNITAIIAQTETVKHNSSDPLLLGIFIYLYINIFNYELILALLSGWCDVSFLRF